ncbi:MAG: hypothetical protein WBB65_07240 [Anaerolineales bacterium]
MPDRSRLRIVIKWFGINGSFFLGAFFVVGILCLVFPNSMLSLFGKWANLLSAFGARPAGDFTSALDMFLHIVQRNAVAIIVYIVIGFLLQAPLAMIFGGAFYAFVSFLAPLTLGSPFELFDWLLIVIESSSLIIASSISSGVAGDLYHVRPSVGEWWSYSKKSWRSLTIKPAIPWRDVLPGWHSFIWPSLVLLGSLTLFVAWFEVYGY